MQTIPAETLAGLLTDRTARGIARDTTRLIRAGTLATGTRMPPLRDLAYVMGISPGTLSGAWKELRRLNVLSGRGRNGTFICGSSLTPRPSRYSAQGVFAEGVLDLTMASPDPALLPPVDRALAHGARAEGLNSYHRVRILPELERALRHTWPNKGGTMLAVNGGYNGVYLALHALVPQGSVVAIERPAPMRLLDILDDLGAMIVEVASDRHGPDPRSLAAALATRPTAFIFQPVLSAVTGHYCTPERMRELGDVLAGSETLVIEDDGFGALAIAPAQSLADRFPDRVVHVRSFSKSLGPDLRMAVLGASESIVEQIQSYRSFSTGWTSRILQASVAWLLNDADTRAAVGHAGKLYAERRNALAGELRRRGIDVGDGGGLCLFAPVQSETFALITLAAHGIAAISSDNFALEPSGHIRCATSRLAGKNVVEVANAICRAAQGTSR
ncbi:MAG: PLP-dependent aminotransferase family protein [Rhodobacteraceae bacterium]|nr:PLP-dependent aminotransferase family protein [Paracoccaceae bacterium]